MIGPVYQGLNIFFASSNSCSAVRSCLATSSGVIGSFTGWIASSSARASAHPQTQAPQNKVKLPYFKFIRVPN